MERLKKSTRTCTEGLLYRELDVLLDKRDEDIGIANENTQRLTDQLAEIERRLARLEEERKHVG
jgi:hypothetical protein